MENNLIDGTLQLGEVSKRTMESVTTGGPDSRRLHWQREESPGFTGHGGG